MTKSSVPAPVRDQIPHREIWGGAAAMLAAGIMIAVFTGMLHTGSVLGNAPSHSSTPTPTPLAATATPGPLTAAQAWGSAITTVPLQLADGTQFSPTDVSPDGTYLVGLAPIGTGQAASVNIALLPVPASASGNMARVMFTMPVGTSTAAVKTDGRFVVWIGGIGDGSTGVGPTRQIVGYFDRQNRSYVIMRDTTEILVNSHAFAVGHGYFVWTRRNPDFGLYATNLVTGATTYYPLNQPIAADISNPVQIAWPNALYITDDHVAHLLNLQTGHVTNLSQVTIAPFNFATGQSTKVLLTGAAFNWSQLADDRQHTIINAVMQPDQPGAAGHVIASLSGITQSLAGITDQFIAYTANDRYVAWDRHQQREIILGDIPLGNSPLDMGLQGTTLWYIVLANGQLAAELVDLAHLP